MIKIRTRYLKEFPSNKILKTLILFIYVISRCFFYDSKLSNSKFFLV